MLLSLDDLELKGEEKEIAEQNFKKYLIEQKGIEEKREKEQAEKSSRDFNRQSQQLHFYSEMRIAEQVEAMRRIEAEKKTTTQPPFLTVQINDAVIQPTKLRKKLKPLERETNEGLLLIYEITGFYKIDYLDELLAIKAWGKIVSAEFQNDLIKSVSPAKTFIILSGGDKLAKSDFLDKYRKRFI
jgi:hypothetical protein